MNGQTVLHNIRNGSLHLVMFPISFTSQRTQDTRLREAEKYQPLKLCELLNILRLVVEQVNRDTRAV